MPALISIIRRLSSSTTRRAMPISPTGSGMIPAPQRRLSTPAHCGCSGESTILCALPTAPSPTPSRQRMLRRRLMRWQMRRCWGFCGATPKQSRPTASGVRHHRSPSTRSRRPPVAPADWRCASHAGNVTARTSGPKRPTRWTQSAPSTNDARAARAEFHRRFESAQFGSGARARSLATSASVI